MTNGQQPPGEPSRALRGSIGVLVLDPEQAAALDLTKALYRRGYNCNAVSCPHKALDMLRGGTYSILIAELNLPVMPGTALMAKLRQLHADVRTVFVSAAANVEMAVEVAKLGAADVIQKPFDLDDLCRRVDALAAEMLPIAPGSGDFQAPDTLHCGDLPGYKIIKRIGAGAMGSVFQARQRNLNRLVAIKVIRGSAFADASAQQRFVIEAHATARMNHPNIIQVYDLIECGGSLFLIMEYFPSRELSQVVAVNGKLSWQRAVSLVRQIAGALVHASSQGIVHRDVKPENILIGKGWAAKLTDFGLAHDLAAPHSRRVEDENFIVGAPAYLSPEQVCSERHLDVRSDIYSLGICLFYMIEGHDPYRGSVADLLDAHLNELLPPLTVDGVPDSVRTILVRMTAKKRADRYQDAAELLAALRKV